MTLGHDPKADPPAAVDPPPVCPRACQGEAGAGGTMTQVDRRSCRAEVAQRKYLAAMKALATVRALLPRGLIPASPLKVVGARRERA